RASLMSYFDWILALAVLIVVGQLASISSRLRTSEESTRNSERILNLIASSLERQLDQLETLSSISNSLSDLRDQSLDMLELQKGIEFGLVGSKPSVFSKNAHVNLVDEIVALKGLVEEIDSELKI